MTDLENQVANEQPVVQQEEVAVLEQPVVEPEIVENLITATPIVEPVKETPKAEKPAKKTKSKDAKKIALYSDKNLHIGAASLKIGYNIVSEEAAEKWLKNKSVRKATPEEVKTAFGG